MAVPVKSEEGSPDRKLPFDCSNVIEPLRCLYCRNFETHKLVELKDHFKADHAQSEDNCNGQTSLDCLQLKDHDYCRFEPVLDEKNTKHTDRTKIHWFKCDRCPYKSQKRFNLKTHYDYMHHNRLKVKCHVCEFQTKFQYTLKRHMLQKHADSHDVRGSYLKDHDYFSLATVLDNQSNPFKCQHCPYSATRRNHLTLHIVRMHPDLSKIQWFECGYCPHRSQSKTALDAHYSHHNKSKHKCELCRFESEFKFALKRHIVREHTGPDGVQWFECEHCTYKNKHKGNLRRHVDNLHHKKKSNPWFYCRRCPYRAKLEMFMQQHYSQFKNHKPGIDEK